MNSEVSMKDEIGERFCIRSIEYCSGERYEPNRLTVIVGPNNAGKSRLLRSIRDEILGRREVSANGDWDIRLHFPETSEAFFEHYHVARHLKRNTNGGYSLIDYCSCGLLPNHNGYHKSDPGQYAIASDWKREVETWYDWETDNLSDTPFEDKTCELRRRFGAMFVNFCGTEDRLLFAAGEQYHGLNDEGSSVLSDMFANTSRRQELSRIIREVFGCGVDLDIASRSGYVTPKVIHEEAEEMVRNEDAALYLASKPNLMDEGDGIKGFFAVAMMILSNDKPVILIDEPESHLHPPQAFKLGLFIGQQSRIKSEAQIFVATHSSRLLQGLLASGIGASSMSIVRLSKTGNTRTMNVVNPESFQEILKNPVLKSGRFYEGVFAQTSVLVESEADELIYRAIAEKSEFGNDVLFLNVHGKHQFAIATSFFRCIGADFKIMADLDLINSAELVKKLLIALGCDKERLEKCVVSASSIRSNMYDESCGDKEKAEEDYKLKFKRFKEYDFSQVESDLSDLRSVFDSLGCLVLESGELETILEPDVQYTKNKSKWLNEALAWIDGSTVMEVKNLPIARQMRDLLQ